MSKIFEKRAADLGIILSDEMKRQFSKYYEMLVEWNKVMNLTGITEYEEVYEKHFLDSICIVKAFSEKNIFLSDTTKKVIDIGTGAGFPGIPLKIVFPDMDITLLDSLNKRINFLNAVIEELGLSGIDTIHGRAEDYAKNQQHREKYDLCVSRAVANLSTLSEYCVPFLKREGYFISYKSGEVDEELKDAEKALSLLGGKAEKVVKFKIPETDIGRSFVIINKIQSTPGKYPRKAGLPSKEPLH